jgi:hypothetical protein
MLPERQVRLLTAYVDGELNTPQRRQVSRLLRRSPEARALLRSLQDDSRQIHNLPRLPAPVDLCGPILAAIGPTRPRLVNRPRPVRATYPAWTGWAAAAAVLLAVGMGTFLTCIDTPTRGPGQTANQGTTTQPDVGKGQPSVLDKHVARSTSPGKATEEPGPNPPVDVPGPQRKQDDSNEKSSTPTIQSTPVPDRPEGPVLAAPDTKGPAPRMERVELALPIIHELFDLDRPENARKLREQLVTAPSFRIELLARDASRGLQRLRLAATSQKLSLVLDPIAQARLRKPQFRHDFALFVENITPADLVALLRAVARADRLSSDNRKSAERRFDGSVVVKELSSWDRKELADLLGVDPTTNRPAPPKTQPGLDIRRSLGEQTGTDVADVLAGKRAPRPGTSQPDQAILVLPLSSPRSRSKEVRQFLDQRKPARTGTLQVFLVLRNLPH